MDRDELFAELSNNKNLIKKLQSENGILKERFEHLQTEISKETEKRQKIEIIRETRGLRWCVQDQN